MWSRFKVGQEISNIYGLVHVFLGAESKSPSSIVLELDNSEYVCFSGRADGWQLAVSNELPLPVAMGECGEMILKSFANVGLLGAVVGEHLQGFSQLTRGSRTRIVGVKMSFTNDLELNILVWDDDLIVSENPEKHILDELAEEKVF